MTSAPPSPASERRTGFRREDVAFRSQGGRCAAWLYRPEGASPAPLVVMAHGFAAERGFGLPAFAERFAGLGLAVLLFDYRCFGASEGTPRQWVSPRRHNQDWDAAIDYGRGLDGVDAGRLVLWGTSFSGGHVISTAARRRDVRAIIAQVPFVDGRGGPRVPLRQALRCLGAGLRDGLHALARRPPYCIPVVGPPGSVAALNTPECEPGYRALIPEGSRWENRVPARIFLSVARYRPIQLASQVTCPALLVLADEDSLIPASAVERSAARIPDCRLERLPCNHFAPYRGEWLQRNLALQEAFLRERVL